MTHRRAEHKQMPNRMGVAAIFCGIKDRSHRVQHAAQNDQYQRRRIQRMQHILDNQHRQPAHPQIGKQRGSIESVDKKHLEHNPGQSDAPQHPKQHQRLAGGQSDQQNWRVRSGDQRKNGAVIQPFEYRFRPRIR